MIVEKKGLKRKQDLQMNFSHKSKYSPKAKLEEPPDINESKAWKASATPPHEIWRVSVSPEHNNDPRFVG